MLNRIGNANNPFQGDYKRVLCVCSAGLLRSPTTAYVLSSEPYNYNTRAAGIHHEYALIPVDEVLLKWAQEIVCMEQWHKKELQALLDKFKIDKKIVCLDIADCYEYRNPELISKIREAYDRHE